MFKISLLFLITFPFLKRRVSRVVFHPSPTVFIVYNVNEYVKEDEMVYCEGIHSLTQKKKKKREILKEFELSRNALR